MKILSIRFCNLNSLEGEWEIDLQHPVFASGGIFAITGPTGSGKTTILDAVCLALYGQTPRLEKITTGSNEIMTRHTGECWAEVTFESSLGLFRCNWRQKRARNRPDGRLQQPEHEIVDALTDRVLENRIRDVAQKVRETTGMDYDQFTRSMLLAQGGFSAFLEAKPDERAPILEQITGTGIYSDISMKVHERYAMEREKYRSLMEKAESFLVMAPEAVHELQEELRRIEAEKMNLDAVIRILQERGESSARTEAAREELNRLETEYHQLLTHREEASERFHRYERGVKAAEYEQEWKGLQTLHEQVEGEKRELSHLQELDAKGRQELEAAGDALQQAEEKAGLCISQREATFQMLGRVRSLDTQIADVTAAITADEELKRAGCEKQSELASTRQLLTGRRDGYTAQRMEVEEYLRSHTGDERLIGEYSGIHTRIAVWEENLKRSEETAAALLTAEAEERAADEEFTIRQKRCDEQERKLEGIKSRIAILNDSLDKKKGRCPLSDLRRREGACHLRSEEIRRMGDILLELRREEALIRRLIGDIREAGQLMDRWDR